MTPMTGIINVEVLMKKLQKFMLGFRGELTRAQIEEHGRVRVERKTKSKV